MNTTEINGVFNRYESEHQDPIVAAILTLAELMAAEPPASNLANPPAMMTQSETIAYLRLNVDERDPAERLRNLVRRQRLPCIKRGRLVLFRRTAVDAWLDKRK